MQVGMQAFPIVAAAQLLILLPPSAFWTAAAGVGYGALYSANCLGIRTYLEVCHSALCITFNSAKTECRREREGERDIDITSALQGAGISRVVSSYGIPEVSSLQIPACIASPLGRLARHALGDSRDAGRSAQVVVDPAEHPRGYTGGQGRAVHAAAVHVPAGAVASREAVEQLTNMGFTEARARSALELCDNNVQAAASLLL